MLVSVAKGSCAQEASRFQTRTCITKTSFGLYQADIYRYHDLLERWVGAFNQNNKESFNNIIWKFAPKSMFSGAKTQIAPNIATSRVLELIGMDVYDFCQKNRRRAHKEGESS